MAEPTKPSNTDARFDYTAYRPKGITVEKLDSLADFCFNNSGAGTIAIICTGIKLALALAYIFTRHKMIEAEMMIHKQQYEQNQHGSNRTDLGGDSLDVQRR